MLKSGKVQPLSNMPHYAILMLKKLRLTLF
jgi:hypothetical protein